MRGGAAPLYLFGSMHVLQRDEKWTTPALMTALDQSKECWFEVVDVSILSALIPLLSGFDLQVSLSDRLGHEAYEELSGHLAGRIPGGAVVMNRMKPWLAATLLMMLQYDAGSDRSFARPGSADSLLLFLAQWGTRSVHGLETLPDVLALLSSPTMSEQVEMLLGLLRSAKAMEMAADTLEALEDAWRDGDLDEIADVMEEMRSHHPTLHALLLSRRNERWLEIIEDMLQRGAAALVTVGVGHLVGDDGLPAMLRQRGYVVERIQ